MITSLMKPNTDHAILQTMVRQARSEYDMTHSGYKINHMTHLLVSMYRLGANENQMRLAYNDYPRKRKLDPLPPSKSRVNSGNWKEFLGRREYYPDYIEFFREQRTALPIAAQAINWFLPDLITGLGGAALHGPIELGWSIIGNLEIEEGLAYCASGYYEFDKVDVSELTKMEENRTLTLMEIFQQVHQENKEKELFKINKEETRKSGFQTVLRRMFTSTRSPDDSVDVTYYGRKKAKQWKADLSTRDNQYNALCEFNYTAMRLFYSTNCKDFFIMHMLTGSHALKQIAKTLNSTEHVHQCIEVLLEIAIYVYIMQGCPDILCDTSVEPKSDTFSLWQNVSKRAIEHNDEHAIKVVDVCMSTPLEYPGCTHEGLCLAVADRILSEISDIKSYYK